MARTSEAAKTTRRGRVFEQLLGEIQSGALAPGERLPSIGKLCARFGTGRSTVQLALGELAEMDLIERRHGSGTFVAGTSNVSVGSSRMLLCMPVSSHVYSELYGMLLRELHAGGRFPMVVDTESKPKRVALRAALRSDVQTIVVHGNMHFPFDELREPARRGVTLIGILGWETKTLRDVAHRVLLDMEEAGRCVARHLHERGHRRVLVLGTSTQVHYLTHREAFRGDHQRGFVTACDDLGIEWTAVDASGWLGDTVSLGDGRGRVIALDAREVLAPLRGRAACTAVYGMMDAHAWAIQDLMARKANELLDRIDIIGLGDTPWSRFGKPPFTSVAWNIDSIAHETALLVDGARARRGGPIEVYVKPNLIARGDR